MRRGWAKKALLNTACSGKFTSDRTIQEYVDDIWHLDGERLSGKKKIISMVVNWSENKTHGPRGTRMNTRGWYGPRWERKTFNQFTGKLFRTDI